jgi:Holliday junction resolvase RusA-like endonuclease
MKLLITGNPPSQKNDKEIGWRYSNAGKKVPFIMSSKKTKQWRADAAKELWAQFVGFRVTDFPINLSIVFYFKKEERDLDNAAAAVMDAMVEAGILPDDNVKYVECITLQFGGIDKTNPRTEIYLDE